MPSLSGGSAERLGLGVERLRQPLENHRRRNALDLPALEDADEALRDLARSASWCWVNPFASRSFSTICPIFLDPKVAFLLAKTM
jgi:hypothetical protein